MSHAELIESIESMTVLDLVELKKTLEERWHVTTLPSPREVYADDIINPLFDPDEQIWFTVTLTGWGDHKINVIKAVRELTTLGLKEAKDLVESVPSVVRADIPRDEAASVVARLAEAGATAVVS